MWLQKTHRIALASIGVALLVIVGLFSVLSTYAAGDASVSLSPGSGTYSKGSTVTVTASLNTSEGVYATTLKLQYDSSQLQYLSRNTSGSAFAGQIWGGDSGSVLTLDSYVNTPTPVTGSGQQIASFSFRVLGDSGSGTVRVTSGTDIVNAAEDNLWNGAQTTASFTLAAQTASAPTTTSAPANNDSSQPQTVSNPSSPVSPQEAAPTEEETQQNAALDDEQPVQINDTFVDQTGYIVQVRVLDENNEPSQDVEVTLGDQTTLTDAEGIATFINIIQGDYTLRVLGVEQSISVEPGEPTDVQEFSVTVDDDSGSIWPAVIIVALLILLIGIGVFLLKKRMNAVSKSPLNGPQNENAAEQTVNNTQNDLNEYLKPSPPKPEDTINPDDKS